ncbi:hypothetical protein KP509_03G095700 [Ceratopteris richardii]|nr:hypothetical protein KP509_03G095700 [Ceratopteris richardii]
MPTYGFASPKRHVRALTPKESSYSQLHEDSHDMNSVCTRFSDSTVLPVESNNKSKTDSENEKENCYVTSCGFSDSHMHTSPEVSAEPRGSPLFDLSLLAAFENALQYAVIDDHQSPINFDCQSDASRECSDSIANENSSMGSGSLSSSDLENFHSHQEAIYDYETLDSVDCQDERTRSNRTYLKANSFLSEEISFSRVSALRNHETWRGKDYLNRFDTVCPPGGENKVVLYFTSLRAVRRTFRNCALIRSILQGLRVHADERDVWMHSNFRKELTDIMGKNVPVPRLFILGRHIGGAEEVEQLHEEGILVKMLEGLSSSARQECHACRGIRFVPCTTCCGSCRLFSSADETGRCPDCNENGLMMCPHCKW